MAVRSRETRDHSHSLPWSAYTETAKHFLCRARRTVSTENPLHPLDADDELAEGLKSLAQRIYLDFNLDSLVRIDVRGDEEGRLHIMEANPQPDLGGPGRESDNRVCAGLGEHDMTYDDLVLSLLANRLDFLLTFRPKALAHVESVCTS